MTTAHDILMNYRAYLASTFGAEAWVFEAQLPAHFFVSEDAQAIRVRATGSEAALGGLEKACELYAIAVKKLVVFNGLAFLPEMHDDFAELAA